MSKMSLVLVLALPSHRIRGARTYEKSLIRTFLTQHRQLNVPQLSLRHRPTGNAGGEVPNQLSTCCLPNLDTVVWNSETLARSACREAARRTAKQDRGRSTWRRGLTGKHQMECRAVPSALQPFSPSGVRALAGSTSNATCSSSWPNDVAFCNDYRCVAVVRGPRLLQAAQS